MEREDHMKAMMLNLLVKSQDEISLRRGYCDNRVLSRSAGSSFVTFGMGDFRDCLGEIGVEDLVMSSLKFTWNKSPGRTDGLLKKLDRRAKPRPFKFANFLVDKAEFLPIVKDVWDSHVPGHDMFFVVSKLKLLKKPLRKLKFAQRDLAKKVFESKLELERVQSMMVNDSHNSALRKRETVCVNSYKDALRDEESMLKQRAKMELLSEGDSNTKFFHKTIKRNLNKNRIENVEDINDMVFSGQKVGAQFVKNFQSVFGDAKKVVPIFDPSSLFCKKLSLGDDEFMVRPVTKDEIKSVSFGMNDDKAPRPDGFSSKIFKSSWSIIGDEVCV
ncbi:hypothetical protein Tco_0339422 [Tanacetum coccineum]